MPGSKAILNRLIEDFKHAGGSTSMRSRNKLHRTYGGKEASDPTSGWQLGAKWRDEPPKELLHILSDCGFSGNRHGLSKEECDFPSTHTILKAKEGKMIQKRVKGKRIQRG